MTRPERIKQLETLISNRKYIIEAYARMTEREKIMLKVYETELQDLKRGADYGGSS